MFPLHKTQKNLSNWFHIVLCNSAILQGIAEITGQVLLCTLWLSLSNSQPLQGNSTRWAFWCCMIASFVDIHYVFSFCRLKLRIMDFYQQQLTRTCRKWQVTSFLRCLTEDLHFQNLNDKKEPFGCSALYLFTFTYVSFGGLKAKKYVKFSVVIPGDLPSPSTSKANRRQITAAVERVFSGIISNYRTENNSCRELC